jgi:hypothetical protein
MLSICFRNDAPVTVESFTSNKYNGQADFACGIIQLSIIWNSTNGEKDYPMKVNEASELSLLQT